MKGRDITTLNWAAGRSPSVLQKQALVLENLPLEGYRLQHMVGRYSTDNKVWRVLDPRGFELEIMTENLDFLFNHCDVKDRVLQGSLNLAHSL